MSVAHDDEETEIVASNGNGVRIPTEYDDLLALNATPVEIGGEPKLLVGQGKPAAIYRAVDDDHVADEWFVAGPEMFVSLEDCR